MKEQSFQHIIVIYLVVINVATFFTYGIDKWKAKCSKWRIREAALLRQAVLGGSVGAWLGMKVWHHKTMHKKFKYGLPLILLAQIALIAYIISRLELERKTLNGYEENIGFNDVGHRSDDSIGTKAAV